MAPSPRLLRKRPRTPPTPARFHRPSGGGQRREARGSAAVVGLSRPFGVRPLIAAFPISLALFACGLRAGQSWAQMGESGDE
jgi:hypothetical protein